MSAGREGGSADKAPDVPSNSEKAREVYRQRKGPRQGNGVVDEHERLFIGPRFQQSISEVDRAANFYPDILDLFRERERRAATPYAAQYLPGMDLCVSQQFPAQGF